MSDDQQPPTPAPDPYCPEHGDQPTAYSSCSCGPRAKHTRNEIGGRTYVEVLALHGLLRGPTGPTGAAPQPDTAPDEGAVEALARVTHDADTAGISTCPPWEDADDEARGYYLTNARAALAALDRGAIPGYGPTGASVGAGEVVVRRDDVAVACDVWEAHAEAYGKAVTEPCTRLRAALRGKS